MKQALVTGSSSGIGKAIVELLQKNGWKVIGLSREDMDLADLNQAANESEKLSDKIDRLDALIHVAGIWHNDKNVFANTNLEDYSSSQIANTMNVGVTSFMLIASALLPKMSKDSVVVGISGTFEDGANGWLPYYTSKRALEDFLRGLAQDYPKGPKVFGVSPADTATPAYAKFFPEYLGEAQPPKVVAELLLQLVNGESHYKTGDIIEIRGGKAAPKFHG